MDVLNCEFSGSIPGPQKFIDDHVKILRESKIILDNITNRPYFPTSEKRRLIIPCFQASALDGEVKIMKLSVPGLYTVQHFGSVPIPNDVRDLSLLRKKCLPRLKYIRTHALKNAGILTASLKKEVRAKKSRSSSYCCSLSYDEDSNVDACWTHGTWFPSLKNQPIVIPSDLI
ncbi:hypothetical protein BDF14DRAFT_1737393 [Spinellus fusiger]|nr:hypothetical protein BDF14DRAFT_1737393 [Spinellus fusiger]